MSDALGVDAAIFGGGAAGLWLLDELRRAGFAAVLLEAHELGAGQTIASQGIIHGGLKYTLGGLFTPSARAISEMPASWRRCLAGESKPDLSNTRLRAEFCHLWQTTSITSRLAMIGARAGLRVVPVKLSDDQRPAALADCPGVVARLDEQVIEPASFLNDLREQHRARIVRIDAEHGLEFVSDPAQGVSLIRLINPETGDPLDVRPGMVIFAAGAGNEALRSSARLANGAMQRRPLHMVLVRGRGDLPVLNGHCVDGATTRATITSTRDFSGRTIWQVGGKIAEDGAQLESHELARHARSELQAILPGVEFAGTEWASYRVDRAEPKMRSGKRPEDSFAMREGNVITAWPTKLALAPALAIQVLSLMEDAKRQAGSGSLESSLKNWPRPVVALPPWEIISSWFADL